MTTLDGLKVNPLPSRCVRTHYEIRCIKDGRVTLMRDCEDTLNLAREAADYKARALGAENFFELEPGENFDDEATRADGVYLTTVRTETVARAI
jgi:hypothetical protein